MADLSAERRNMVAHQIEQRGVRSAAVARAMREVPREEFMSEALREFAYTDAPLPIAEGQTISQPYIVAYMIEALGLEGGERVLEVGTGSGYAAAVLSRIAGEVYTIERHAGLAQSATENLRRLGYHNVHVITGDGTRGWRGAAPYDAIVVAAGGSEVPAALRDQLVIGGRLVIPIGPSTREQRLVRIVRASEDEFEEEDLLPVRFVPLIGEQGWPEPDPAAAETPAPARSAVTRSSPPESLPQRIASAAERFNRIEEAKLAALLERIGEARLVLLGEATQELQSSIVCDSALRRGSSSARGSTWWPWKPTGRMPRASTTTFATAMRHLRSGKRSRASRSGCGAMPRSKHRSPGCTPTMPSARTLNGFPSTGSISTACTRRSTRCWVISSPSIPNVPASRAAATAVSAHGNRTRPTTVAWRSPVAIENASRRLRPC